MIVGSQQHSSRRQQQHKAARLQIKTKIQLKPTYECIIIINQMIKSIKIWMKIGGKKGGIMNTYQPSRKPGSRRGGGGAAYCGGAITGGP